MIELATRGSPLAIAQAQEAVELLRRRFPEQAFELRVVASDGDLDQQTEVAQLAGQGWFTSRLDREVAAGRVAGAVHSAKDLPTVGGVDELAVTAYLPRADPRDALVLRKGGALEALPEGATLGTSSPRRAAQLKALRPDLRILPMRGNVDTRLRKVERGDLDGCVVAMAALLRIGASQRALPLDPLRECTPAPAQGAIAIRAGQGGPLAELAASISDPLTERCVQVERAVLQRMGGGCRLPLGVLVRADPQGRAELLAAWAAEAGGVRRLRRNVAWSELDRAASEVAGKLR